MTRLRAAVLISGSGSTLANLIEYQRRGELPIDFAVVISSNPKAGGLRYALQASIATEVVARKTFADQVAHSEQIFGLCRAHEVQLVVMGGYLEHLGIPDDFANRVINIHPALIPAFSGQGYYGLRVHTAAIEYGVKLSGCTVHFVDNQYDHGPIIAQRSCPVLDGDTPQDLQHRVGELERQLYPQVIADIAAGRVTVTDRRVLVGS
ncbi:MAG: phosphoribosylglycinamide formyltransferase [Planctomycetales bacterium]|nr:phosphoribosylglycinamide formyltransferase [Planctomycetales bacterium]MCA9179832.1 phosphoribosylglycinamide formyltransferase [Planctomycetales bacterium]